MSPYFSAVTRLVFSLVTSAALMGCTATPVPEPPPAAPGEPGPVDFGGFGAAPICPVDLKLAGRAKPGFTVWALDLDLQTRAGCDPMDPAPITTTVPKDGNYTLNIDGFPADEIRLQLRDGDKRGPPVDFVVGLTSGPLARAPREACLAVDLELGLGEVAAGESVTRSVRVRNDCSGLVTLESLGLRSNEPAFTILAQAPIDIMAGTESTVDVQFTPQTPGLAEEILFLNTSGLFTERRPVTLYGLGL